MCKLQPKQWHRFVPLVLWSIREARNQTLGTSPFMMAFGRNPGNPLSLLKETWSGENPLLHTAGKTVTEYLTELQSKLKQIHDFAEPSNSEMASSIVCVLKGQDDEKKAQKCHDHWCCSQCIRTVAYSYAICHRMPGSYNVCGITVESSDSDLHCYQSLSDTLKVGLFILVSMAIIIFGAHSQFLTYSVSQPTSVSARMRPKKRQTYQMGPWLAGIWYSLGI